MEQVYAERCGSERVDETAAANIDAQKANEQQHRCKQDRQRPDPIEEGGMFAKNGEFYAKHVEYGGGEEGEQDHASGQQQANGTLCLHMQPMQPEISGQGVQIQEPEQIIALQLLSGKRGNQTPADGQQK